MKMLALFLLFTLICRADTPPPGSVFIKGGTNSTLIGNISDSQKVNVTNSSIPVTGTFFQSIQPVSQSGTWTFGRTWSLSSGTDSVTAIQTALSTGSISNTSVSGTAVTITAPANTIGFILESDSTNTANIRWVVGATATSSVGNLYEPGRDTGYVPLAGNISVIALSGTQTVSVQWVVR